VETVAEQAANESRDQRDHDQDRRDRRGALM
jgi:hypothetical protein